MEAVGLAVGFIGLAGLFSTCVDCFKLVQVYDSRSRDYEIFQTMLDNQQFHFMAWGKACGFMDADRTNSRFDDPLGGSRNKRIEQTLERVQSLLTNGDSLKEKYGLKVHRAPIGAKLIEGAALSAFSKAFQSTKAYWNTSLQRKSQISGTIRWAVSDRDNFEKLIQQLRDLLADLTKFTDEMGISDSQRFIVEYEMEMIDDEHSLEAIAAASACEDDDDLVSLTASRRLTRVKAQSQSVANRSVMFDDSASMASVVRYDPSLSTLVEEEEMEGVTQEVGITRVPLTEWRKFKTRAGILPWLKILLVATSASSGVSPAHDDIQPLSRQNTMGSGDPAVSRERLVRLAINSRILITILRKVTGFRLSPDQNVMVYPFKPLITYENELRHYLVKAQSNLQSLKEAQDQNPATSEQCQDSDQANNDELAWKASKEIETLARSIEEMECLINFMDNDMHELFRIRNQAKEKTLQEVAFEHLWLVFQPGLITFSPGSHNDSSVRAGAYQVLHVTGGRPIIDVENHSKTESTESRNSWDPRNQDGLAVMSSRECTDFVIDCYYMDFDGAMYGPRAHVIVIPEYSGVKQLTSLPLFPILPDDFHRLIERGKKFLDCIAGGLFVYQGAALPEWDVDHRESCDICARNSNREHLNGHVIIDHGVAIEQCRNAGCHWAPSFGGSIIAKASSANKKEAFESVDCSNPNCRACTDVFNDAIIDLYLRDRFIRSSNNWKVRALKLGERLPEEQLLLLPFRVCGYSLHRRRSYPLDVDFVQRAHPQTMSMRNLAIGDENKKMLSALLESQARRREQNAFEDLIPGKGEGTIILLHGPPGVGKTLTAEFLAVNLDRPLLSIRIADLGTTPKALEENFTQYFKLAERWNCVMLMNDADAILERRRVDDREGNSIITVFIDALEYFSGILILATNRVGTFDDAVMSRIHVSLYYPPLDRATGLLIWKTFLKQIDDMGTEVYDEQILEFVNEMYENGSVIWNGRKIRNTIKTALSMAREEAKSAGRQNVKLQPEHFKAVVASTLKFTQYTSELHAVDETKRAFTHQETLDSFRSLSPTRPVSTSKRIEPVQRGRPRRNIDMDVTEPNVAQSESEDDDLEIQELELKLEMAKLKRKQKALKAKKIQRVQRRHNFQASDGPDDDDENSTHS